MARRKAHSGDARAGRQLVLTEKGSVAVQRLSSARHDAVAELLEGWSSTEHDELGALVARLAADVSKDDNAFPADGAAVDAGKPIASAAR